MYIRVKRTLQPAFSLGIQCSGTRSKDVASEAHTLIAKAEADKLAVGVASATRSRFGPLEVRRCTVQTNVCAVDLYLLCATPIQAMISSRPKSRIHASPADLLCSVDALLNRLPPECNNGDPDQAELRAYATALKNEVAAAEAFRVSAWEASAAVARLACESRGLRHLVDDNDVVSGVGSNSQVALLRLAMSRSLYL